jgi:predicted lipid-binding transport protein (Tim44 family)
MLRTVSRRNRALFALAGLVALTAAGVAEARAGRGGGLGSRGDRTFGAPAQTQTAPNAARPIERSQTTPSQVQRPAPAPTPGVGAPTGSRFGGGFFAGLLGAGLLGALFGAGLFGGLGSLASILGFLLQIALIGGLVFLAIRFFRRRQQPAMAQAPGGLSARSGYGERPVPPLGGMGLGGGLPGGARAQPAPAQAPVQVAPEDFDAFERTLHEVQDAYNRQDVATLWTLATPEMAGYFQEQLNDNAREGVVDRVSGIKLLQGDLSEAWREGETEYATVAMRFALTEATVETATGRVVSGNPNEPTEATEIWTFRRDRGGPWKLSAIQQTT